MIEDHFDRQFELEVTLEGSQQARRPGAAVAATCPAARHHELHPPAVAARPRPRGLVRARGRRQRAVRAAAAGRAGAAQARLPRADDRGLQRRPASKSNIIAVEEVPPERIHNTAWSASARPRARRFADHRDGREAAAREGAVQSDHHRALHPAAGDLRAAWRSRRAAPAARSRSPTR